MILASQENIQKWTESGAWGTKTFIDYFKGHVRRDPDKVCLVDPLNKEALLGLKPERLTYRELDRAVDAVAEGLLAKGIQKDDIILVQLPNCWELAMLYLAITRAGALISPMPMQWRLSELDYIAGLTKAVAMITVETFGNFKHRELAEKLQAKHPRSDADHPSAGDPGDDPGGGHGETGGHPDRSQRYLYALLVFGNGGGTQRLSAVATTTGSSRAHSATRWPRSCRGIT